MDRDFYNAELVKPITDTNEKMIEKMEEKHDKINEIISNTLPYYEDQDQDQDKEQLTLPYNEENETLIYDISKPLLPKEKEFLNDLSKNGKVPIYIKKNGETIYADVKIIGVDNILKSTDDELINDLKNKDLKSLGNKISAYYKYNKDNKLLLLYRNAITKYQKIIKIELSNRELIEKNEEVKGEEVEGEGIKTKKNVMHIKL